MNEKKLLTIFAICLTSCSFQTQNAGENGEISILQNLIKDFHLRYAWHLGENNSETPLSINMCFYQKDSIPYVALTGYHYIESPCSFTFFYSEDGKIRRDIEGYCQYDIDGLCVYNSVEGDNYRKIEPYLQGLDLDLSKALNLFDSHFDHSDETGDFYTYTCVYRIDSCGIFQLVDSGYLPRLNFIDFIYDDWPDRCK